MQNRLRGVNYRNTNRNSVEQRAKKNSTKNRGEETEKLRRYDARHMGGLKFIICKRNRNGIIIKIQRLNVLQNVIYD